MFFLLYSEGMAILVLRETLTWMSVLGMALSLAGLFISEYKGRGRKNQPDLAGAAVIDKAETKVSL